MQERILILHGFKREELNEVIKAVKGVLGKEVDLISAITTPTSLEWKVKDLIEELRKEHRYFKRKDEK